MGENGNFTITTYSYATQWDNTEQMPKLIVKVPLTKIQKLLKEKEPLAKPQTTSIAYQYVTSTKQS